MKIFNIGEKVYFADIRCEEVIKTEIMGYAYIKTVWDDAPKVKSIIVDRGKGDLIGFADKELFGSAEEAIADVELHPSRYGLSGERVKVVAERMRQSKVVNWV